MFARSLLLPGGSITLVSLPRQSWTCRAIEDEYPILGAGMVSARLGEASQNPPSAMVCFHWALLPAGLAVARLRNIPLIYDEHDGYALNTLEGNGAKPLRLILKMLIGLVHRICVPRVALVTCIHQKGGGLHGQLSALNSNCIELANTPDERWQPAKASAQDGPLHFIYAGGVFAEKGVAAAIAACKLANAAMPDAVRLDVFGKGDPKLPAQMADLAGVTFHGEVSSGELRRFAAGHRCCGMAVLSRTRRYDLVGTNLTKLYEYLALGMPVIVSNSGETGGFVSASGTGIVIENPEDQEALAAAMVRLATDRSFYAECSAAALALMARADMRWGHEWRKVAETGVFGVQPNGMGRD